MSFIPYNVTYPGGPVVTVWSGLAFPWGNATDKERFEIGIKRAIKQLTNVDFTIQGTTFTTKTEFDRFCATFPQGQDWDKLFAQRAAMGITVGEIAEDVSSLDDKAADETPEPPA